MREAGGAGVSALEERRQRAREAGRDAYDAERDGGAIFEDALEAAIEAATRVRITLELLAAMDPGVGNRETRLIAAFRAAGFEVEE